MSSVGCPAFWCIVRQVVPASTDVDGWGPAGVLAGFANYTGAAGVRQRPLQQVAALQRLDVADQAAVCAQGCDPGGGGRGVGGMLPQVGYLVCWLFAVEPKGQLLGPPSWRRWRPLQHIQCLAWSEW